MAVTTIILVVISVELMMDNHGVILTWSHENVEL